MDILVSVFLPLALAVIMLSLGVGLTPADFRRVAERNWVFAVGALCQIVLLPLVAFGVVMAFGLSGALAAGVMLLSFCPGGVTSNVVSRFARADVALSVSLTALISLMSIVTVPMLVGWAVTYFMGADAPEFSVTSLALAMFLITMLPICLGMGFRQMTPDLAARIEPGLLRVASLLFIVVVLAAIAANFSLLLEHAGTLGPALVTLSIVTMGGGLALAALLGLNWAEQKTISIEVGFQNSILGITLGPIIAGTQSGLAAIALPSALYGVVMYLTAIPFVLWLRSRRDDQ